MRSRWPPLHFALAASRGDHENLIFHRVIPDFMIQTGDPTATGAYDCGFTLPDEFVAGLKFDRPGRLAMANEGPRTAACQFFITADLVPEWNQKYTIFGQVVRGMDVVDAISHAPVHGDKPVDPVKLLSVTISRIGPEPQQKGKN